MSEDKLSEWEMREEIKNLLSWGHAHDYDDILREARADAWDEGADALEHHQMHVSGGWPNNPYREQEEA